LTDNCRACTLCILIGPVYKLGCVLRKRVLTAFIVFFDTFVIKRVNHDFPPFLYAESISEQQQDKSRILLDLNICLFPLRKAPVQIIIKLLAGLFQAVIFSINEILTRLYKNIKQFHQQYAVI